MLGKDMEFTPEILFWEQYATAGMRATVTAVGPPTVVEDDFGESSFFTVEFDFSKFEEHNLQFEEHAYYDKAWVPCLTAREAGVYTSKGTYYFEVGSKLPFKEVTG